MDIKTEGEVTTKTCIVVNDRDEVLKIGELAECHERPMTLHRAFSLFVFDEQGRLLLQQRAKTKYTFPLAWTNTVCSHPRNLKKTLEEWIDLRIQDELGWGIKNMKERLKTVGKLQYEAISDFKYGEKEIDTLYFLQVTEDEKDGVNLNPAEVEAIDWVEPGRLRTMMFDDRFLLTPWFRAIARGFGFPFYDRIKTVALGDVKSLMEKEDDGGLGPEEATGNTHWLTYEESDFRTLPFFRVGNLSMPSVTDDLILQAPFSYLSSNPGKALRTQLVKLYGDMDAGVTPQDVEGISWVVERIHTASLLHDDIEDKSSSRRGAVCAHLIWGVAQTINTGTFNFLKAIEACHNKFQHHDETTRSKLTRAVLQTIMSLHRGQGCDISWGEYSQCPTIVDYVKMIDFKTGALFQACAKLGSILSGNGALGTRVCETYKELARYFQIRDDFCNVCDPVYWKAKGFYEDADEGKYSYPVLLFFEKPEDSNVDEKQGEVSSQEWLRMRLADQELSIPEKLQAYKLLYNSKALHETREHLVAKLEVLKETLSQYPRAQKLLDVLNIVDIPTPEQVQEWVSVNSTSS